MISVMKGLQEKETNYDCNELTASCVKAAEPNSEWWTAEPLPIIPGTARRNQYPKLTPMPIGLNILRHGAMIFDLEPDDYVIVICAAPTVSAPNFLITCIHIQI